MDPHVQVSKVIRKEMKRQGVTVTALAKRMKVSREYVLVMLDATKHNGKLTFGGLRRICRALDCDMQFSLTKPVPAVPDDEVPY